MATENQLQQTRALKEANEIQADLVNATKDHTKKISKQNTIMIWLTVAIAVLTLVLVYKAIKGY